MIRSGRVSGCGFGSIRSGSCFMVCFRGHVRFRVLGSLWVGNSLALILDIGMVAVLISIIGHNLGSAIWKSHSVLAFSLVAISGFGVGEIITRITVLHGITKGIVMGDLEWESKVSS